MPFTRIAPGCVTAIMMYVLVITNSHAEAISVGTTQGLAFGDLVAGNGGSVSVGTDGTRSTAGGVFLIPSSDGTPARFTITGSAFSTYTIQLPPNDTVMLTGPGIDMTVTDFISTPSGAGGQLDASGTQLLNVGATLLVGSGQASGDYTGNFSVIVEYN